MESKPKVEPGDIEYDPLADEEWEVVFIQRCRLLSLGDYRIQMLFSV